MNEYTSETENACESIAEGENEDQIKTDMEHVYNPSHYQIGNLEVIDIIKATQNPEQFIGYCDGNVKKYILRWQKKNGLEDLKKARVYLEWLIEFMGSGEIRAWQ